jgi:hypothetical protein
MRSISAGHSALRILHSTLGRRSNFKVSAAMVRVGAMVREGARQKEVACLMGPRSSCRGMPQSLSAVYIHLAFSTKNRRPLLRDAAWCVALHAYLGNVSKNLDCPPILVGGAEDHVHLLCHFGRTIAQAE